MIEGNNVDIIYFDFSKALDTDSFHYLQEKMKNLCISKKDRKYLKIILTNRTMKIKIANIEYTFQCFSGFSTFIFVVFTIHK